MNSGRPPVIATWLMEHLTPGGRDEALAGDLLEEFLHGKTAGWYRWQCAAVVAAGYREALRTRWPAAIFAAAWVIPVPATFFRIATDARLSRLFNSAWELPWPWSTMCEMSFYVAANLLFLWTGLLTYLALHALTMREERVRVLRGLAHCSLLYLPLSIAWAVLTGLMQTPGHPVDIRHTAAVELILDPHFLPMRVPFFLSLLLSTWAALPARKRHSGKIAA
ncbi:hypothetical protein [Paracidobacterium acidisoli]|uniref:Uncharacterized protein n=1 Tax=Paracidobacterium acidisoli TaxID=2303751 RepID=A0A372IPI2_9BACT|nr:hypothetical protein [Paracidobacterium acidisoli]MBT9331125.1 hypothetical protein [Paracidobacterium acidisoli]